jgi:DNA-binding MarR family transcriptional regulator
MKLHGKLGFEFLRRLYQRGEDASIYQLFPERKAANLSPIYQVAQRCEDRGYVTRYLNDESRRGEVFYELTPFGQEFVVNNLLGQGK